MTNDTLKQLFEMNDTQRGIEIDNLFPCCLSALLQEAWGRAWDAREDCDNDGPACDAGTCDNCDEWRWLISVYDDLSRELGMRVACGQMVAHESHDDYEPTAQPMRDIADVLNFNNKTTGNIRGH